MNKRSLGALIALNALLLTALVVVTFTDVPPANAQMMERPGEYLMVAGDINQTPQAIYIIEQRSSAMSGLIYRSANKKFEPFSQGRVIIDDVRRLGGGAP